MSAVEFPSHAKPVSSARNIFPAAVEDVTINAGPPTTVRDAGSTVLLLSLAWGGLVLGASFVGRPADVAI